MTLNRLWLGDAEGRELSPCSSGEPINAYLWAEFNNKASSPRYSVILLADLYVNKSLERSYYQDSPCVLGLIAPKSISSSPIYSFNWNCGEEIRLSRLILSWETAQGSKCSNAKRKCSSRNTKCYGGATMESPVQIPLAPGFNHESPACCDAELNFTDRTVGGAKPYAYDWDFGDGAHSNQQNPVHSFPKAGSYIVNLTVTDKLGKAATASSTLTIQTCRCTIDGSERTCKGEMETYTALFGDTNFNDFHWRLVGPEGREELVGEGMSIDINWANYDPGLYDLQLQVFSKNSPGKVGECNMTIKLQSVPEAVITFIN
jgi:hypothetical protein